MRLSVYATSVAVAAEKESNINKCSVSLMLSNIHRESKTLDPFSFEQNFRKYCPILIILSLLQREIICLQKHN